MTNDELILQWELGVALLDEMMNNSRAYRRLRGKAREDRATQIIEALSD